MLQGFDLRADRRTGVKITALPVYIYRFTHLHHFLCLYVPVQKDWKTALPVMRTYRSKETSKETYYRSKRDRKQHFL
jgi:hypothetical protein